MTTTLKAIPWLINHAYWIAICTVLILCILPRVLHALLSPVRQIPGPFLARFTRLWYFRQVIRGDFDQVNIQLHRRYGPIVRIAPNEFSFEDLQAIKTIYGHGTKFAKQSINMHHWLQCYAFDVIGLITFSRRFGFLNKGEDIEEIMKSIHNFLHYSALVGIYNEWHKYLFGLIAMVGFKGMKNIVAFSLDRIKRNNERDKGEVDLEEDFLSKALALHRAAPDRLYMGDVISTCTSNVGAGRDTTGISLSSILYYLVRNPLTLRKLRVEIEGETQRGTVSSPITFQEAQRMPYLQAVIKGSLRLHPATGLPLARVVPVARAVIAGTRFPGGTIVDVNTWVAHANASVFSDDARTFRPERWLEDDETTSMLNKFWMPFGVGSRTCIGKNISLLEISKFIPELIRRYDFQLIGMDGGLETRNVWFVKPTNFFCKIMSREPSGL